ncbi:MAG: Txe/YoeB family addiction module toxin [Spirochaetaceae bacterium]|jgi:toxin YoeB|nr:Txe/YoeB family addiction module toxin [Spirochaetaceae bacterium]
MRIIFSPEAFEDMNSWVEEDKKIHTKIVTLIREIQRTPFQGTGKPELLKHEYSGYWSRRLTDRHRLVYKVEKESLYILSCKFHYSNR